jgi:hypothetical protein
MRVACIGNSNNIFFSLARHLRDRGLDADVLLLNDESPHFHPSADTYDSDYQQYTISLAWGKPIEYVTTSKRKILEDVKKYDFIIGCGSTPAYLHKIGRRVDLFIPYGTDIILYPFFSLKRPTYSFVCAPFIRSQMLGIRNAPYLNFDSTNEEMERVVLNLKYPGKRLECGIPMVYTPMYHPDRMAQYYDRSRWYPEFEKIRRNHDIVIFHQTRHVWKNSPDPFSWKGNDKLFLGFSEFVKQAGGVRACIVTCEYGPDVDETKKLVRDLGIEKRVFWFPQMMRKEIMIGLSLSDIGTGEFHMSWLSCGTIYETLAMAKPLMHYREDKLYEKHYPELYPMIHVKTAGDVCRALHDYAARPADYRKIGSEGRQWLQKYAIDDPLNAYMKMMKGG